MGFQIDLLHSERDRFGILDEDETANDEDVDEMRQVPGQLHFHFDTVGERHESMPDRKIQPSIVKSVKLIGNWLTVKSVWAYSSEWSTENSKQSTENLESGSDGYDLGTSNVFLNKCQSLLLTQVDIDTVLLLDLHKHEEKVSKISAGKSKVCSKTKSLHFRDQVYRG